VKQLIVMIGALALVRAACGGSGSNGGATLEDAESEALVEDIEDAAGDVTDEEALLAFAQCMRDNGFDLPDPNFSNFDLAGGVGPFGEIDPTEPDFEEALEACQDIFANLPFSG